MKNKTAPMVAVRAEFRRAGQPRKRLAQTTSMVFIFERDQNFSLDRVRSFLLLNPGILPGDAATARLYICCSWRSWRRFMKWVRALSRPHSLVGWHGPWKLADAPAP